MQGIYVYMSYACNTVYKCYLPCSQAGLNDLDRDPHAGALERSAFLQRAATRAAGAAKAVARAAARAAGRGK